jgi:tRNA A37 threonylcarbamoyladenosine dehydratase
MRSNPAVFWYVLRLRQFGWIDRMNATEREQCGAVADLERRFGGVRRLYGERALERFREAHVCVIGIGGVGSWAAGPGPHGVGRLTWSTTSPNQYQPPAAPLTGTSGMAKVQVMAASGINPACGVTAIEDFITREPRDPEPG